jgi:hypothetical protein
MNSITGTTSCSKHSAGSARLERGNFQVCIQKNQGIGLGMQATQQSKCADLQAPCKKPITKDIGVTSRGGKEIGSNSAIMVEATFIDQVDEKVIGTMHNSTTGPCHLE